MIPIRRKYEFHEDIYIYIHRYVRILQFSTIEILLISGGGNPDDMYDRLMEIAYSKGSKLALNIMNELKNKAMQNLKPVRTLTGFYVWITRLHF